MKKLIVLLVAVVSFVSLFAFVACDNPLPPEVIPPVDYSVDNDFTYEVYETADYVTYVPDANATHGVLFYLGTAIAPKHYDYFASALAKQGYLVVISTNGFPYVLYNQEESTFDEYPKIKFYVAGHSQGGGAAIKRANEHRDRVEGLILFAPLAYEVDSIADTALPSLLLEATNDGVLTADMKAEAKRALPEDREEYLIEGCHMAFSTMDSDETLALFKDGPATSEQKTAQREATLSFVLAFLKSHTTN